MMGELTRVELLELFAHLLANTRWDELDNARIREEVICLAPEELGRRFTEFLKNGTRVFVDKPTRLFVDRERAFDPVDFLGRGWSIWRGPLDGNGIAGRQYHYPSTRRASWIELKTLRLVTMLQPGEEAIDGFEWHRRLAVPGRLDAKVFEALWKAPDLIPEEFKCDSHGGPYQLYFDGTILRSPHGRPAVIYMSFRNAWIRGVTDLGRSFGSSDLSMVSVVPPVRRG